jgi:hypothetical protein
MAPAIRPIIVALVTLALVCCAPDEEEEQSPLHEPCLAACGKAACAADVQIDCRSYCEDAAEQATAIGDPCTRDLQLLFECQAQISCLEYLDWYNEAPGATCLDVEANVVQSCPGVQLR